MAAKAAFSFRAEHIWLSRPINGDPHEMSRGLGQIELRACRFPAPGFPTSFIEGHTGSDPTARGIAQRMTLLRPGNPRADCEDEGEERPYAAEELANVIYMSQQCAPATMLSRSPAEQQLSSICET